MTPNEQHLAAARECAGWIGDEIKRLGDWKGLGAAWARSNVEKHIATLLASTYRRGFEDARERAAKVADDHECGGPDDILCQHQNCGLCIMGAILALTPDET